MRIVFIGTVEFSKQALVRLTEIGADVVGVVTKSKSRVNADFADLTPICDQHAIPYRFTGDVNAAESIAWIRALRPDVIFCFGWSSLLKQELLALAPLGIVGFHPAALPMNRGRHPIIWALVLGLGETGSTFFFMDEGADSGDILSQRMVPISEADDAASLYGKITSTALIQISEFHGELVAGTYRRIEQNHSAANSWRKRGRADGRIDFRMDSRAIYNLVRGLTRPYVGAHIELGDSEIKVWKVSEGQAGNQNLEPGKVIRSQHGTIEVKTGDGSILLVEHEFESLPEPEDYL